MTVLPNDGHGGLLNDMIVDPEVVLQSADRKDDKDGVTIPHICHFLYTGKIFQAKILHPKARKLRQIEFRDKIA